MDIKYELDDMKEWYNTKLNQLNEINHDLAKKIEYVNEINHPNHFKFTEINANGFINKLSRIEKDPQTIWDTLNSVYFLF